MTDGFYTRFSKINEERANVWHPEGLDEWSLSDWSMAMIGEWFELQLVPPTISAERANEMADVVTYALLVGTSAGIDLAPKLDQMAPPEGAHWRPSLVFAFERFSSAVKEHNRNRTGADGKGLTPAKIKETIDICLLEIVRQIQRLARDESIDLQEALCAKFNRISERQDLPHRIEVTP